MRMSVHAGLQIHVCVRELRRKRERQEGDLRAPVLEKEMKKSIARASWV